MLKNNKKFKVEQQNDLKNFNLENENLKTEIDSESYLNKFTNSKLNTNYDTKSDLDDNYLNPEDYLDQDSEIDCPETNNFEENKNVENQKEINYLCEICDKNFSNRNYLTRHLKRHIISKTIRGVHKISKSRPFSCDQCKKWFKTQAHLNKHKKIHRPNKPFKCNLCEKSFHESGNLKKHLKVHAGSREYPCDICGKFFTQKIHLLHHQLVHQNKPYACDFGRCERFFPDLSSLEAHKKNHSFYPTTKAKKRRSGENLTKRSPSKYDYSKYKKDSLGVYQCEHCPKFFASRSGIARHQSIHSGVKPFICEICSRSFSERSNMLRHRKILHDKLTDFVKSKCQYCHKSFNEVCNLRKHEKIHTGERPYKCEFCSKSYIQNCDLVIHRRLHTGELPFKCDICPCAFRTSHLLTRHLKTAAHHTSFKSEGNTVFIKTEIFLECT